MSAIIRRALLLTGLALVVPSVVACAPGNPDVDSLAATQGLPDLLVNLSATEWLLDPAETTVEVGDQAITLDFHPDRTASGVAPCNAYRAVVNLGNDTVTLTEIKKTLRACDPEVMGNEDTYFAALGAVRDVDLTDRDRLILSAPGGARLEFTSFDADDAIATTWWVANIAAEGALTTPPAGVDPLVAFSTDQTVTVDAGCGPRTGSWKLHDGKLTVTGLSPSDGCVPADSASAEAAVISALAGSPSVQISPRTLTLLHPADTVALVATAAS